MPDVTIQDVKAAADVLGGSITSFAASDTKAKADRATANAVAVASAAATAAAASTATSSEGDAEIAKQQMVANHRQFDDVLDAFLQPPA